MKETLPVGRDNSLLVKQYAPLIHKVSARYVKPGFDPCDAYHCGVVGLLEASRRFDWSRPEFFGAYAKKWIAGEVRKGRNAALHLVARNLSVNSTKALGSLVGHIKAHGPVKTGELGSLARELRVPQKSLEEAFQYLSPGSCYISVSADSGASHSNSLDVAIGDLVTDPISSLVEQQYLHHLLSRLNNLISESSGRDEDIVKLRHLRSPSATLKELSHKHGCSIEAVRKAESKLLREWRVRLNT